MTKVKARAWAVLFEKMGFHYKKKEVFDFAIYSSDEDVWNKFVLSNPVYHHVAIENHFYDVFYAVSFLEEVGYAHMRSTYPSRARGRGIIGPKIISLQDLNNKTLQKDES